MTDRTETPRTDSFYATLYDPRVPQDLRDAIDKKEKTFARQLETELSAARDRIAGLEKDAARYRWLKANHLQTGTDSWIRTGDDLEEAIDAALSRKDSQ